MSWNKSVRSSVSVCVFSQRRAETLLTGNALDSESPHTHRPRFGSRRRQRYSVRRVVVAFQPAVYTHARTGDRTPTRQARSSDPAKRL